VEYTTEQLVAFVHAFLWPLFRFGGLLMAMPSIGTHVVPARVRLLLAIALTWVVAPLLPPMPPLEPLAPAAWLTALSQVLIGVAMGFALRLVFSAIEMGAQMLGQAMGLGFAALVDPQNGVQVPVISQLYTLLATLLFFVMDGHLVAIEVLVRSFDTLPVGPAGVAAAGAWELALWGAQMFRGALLLALPALASLLMVNLTFGVMVRAAPQLNIFVVGFPLTLTLGFGIMLVSLPLLLPQFERMLFGAFELMQRLAGG
jgi:flagellar biosynthetic protein FliR